MSQAVAKRACDLRQERAQLLDQSRELVERVAAENREFTAEERATLDDILGRGGDDLGRSGRLAQDISRIERQEANDRATEGDVRRMGDPLPHEDPASKRPYSFTRAILGRANEMMGKGKFDGLEAEVSQELAGRIGKKAQGFYVPTGHRMGWDMHPNYRVGGNRVRPGAHQVEHRIDDTTAGAGAVLTRWDTTWIEYLRARMVLPQLGARIMTDMHGNFQMPRQNGIGTVSWVAESSSVSTTAQTIDQVLFQPKTVGAFTDMSRRFLEQLSIDAELFVREDLAAILARGVETAVYNGSGSPQPTGILGLSGLTVVSTGTNGGAITFPLLVELEEALGKANADLGNLAYVTTPQVKSNLKMTPKQGLSQTSQYPIMIWEGSGPGGGEVNGYPIYSTNLVPSTLTKGSSGAVCSATIFGNWSDAVLAFWSGMDVLVDPYTGGPAGTIRIVVLQDVDFEARHIPSFAAINDTTTT